MANFLGRRACPTIPHEGLCFAYNIFMLLWRFIPIRETKLNALCYLIASPVDQVIIGPCCSIWLHCEHLLSLNLSFSFKSGCSLASIPGHFHPKHFLSLVCSMKNRWEGLEEFVTWYNGVCKPRRLPNFLSLYEKPPCGVANKVTGTATEC